MKAREKKLKNLPIQIELEKLLNHAFRFGSSAFRFGLIPGGISDHLPIVATLTPPCMPSIQLLSWNLLAEEHLFNNFRNVSGIHLMEKAISQQTLKNIYSGHFMYHFYAEISQYLFQKSRGNKIFITRELLAGFTSVANQASRLTTQSGKVQEEKVKQVEEARSIAIDLVLNNDDKLATHEYQLSLKHSMELLYHIKSTDGALRWENRLKKLRENKKAIAELQSKDIIALQECTNPEDIKILLSQDNRVFITHNLSKSGLSTDNVVLMFNSTKYKLIGEPVKSDFKGQKPALYCLLEEVSTGKPFIIGSIHHPGGEHDLRHEIIENVRRLQAGNDEIPYYIAGDYNHTAEQFSAQQNENNPLTQAIYSPSQEGTMSGSDYENTNQAIDGILSNEDLRDKIKRSIHVRPAAPARTIVDIIFPKEKSKQTVGVSECSLLRKISGSLVNKPEMVCGLM